MFLKAAFRPTPLSVKELQLILKVQLVVISIVNTLVSVITLTVSDQTKIEQGAHLASMFLLWATFPFGWWGTLRQNGGVSSLYVVFGLLSGAIRIILTFLAGAVVSASCQMEQMSFSGCYRAIDSLTCLQFSNCTRDAIDNYNSLPTTTVGCDAWSIDDCSDASSTLSSFVFGYDKLPVFIANVLTASLPVYVAYLYFVRFEGSRSVDYKTAPGTELPSDDPITSHILSQKQESYGAIDTVTSVLS